MKLAEISYRPAMNRFSPDWPLSCYVCERDDERQRGSRGRRGFEYTYICVCARGRFAVLLVPFDSFEVSHHHFLNFHQHGVSEIKQDRGQGKEVIVSDRKRRGKTEGEVC